MCVREKGRTMRRKGDKQILLNGHRRDLNILCVTLCFIISLLLLISSTSPRACPSHPCYISPLGLPLNGKQLVWGLPEAHYAQFFNEFPSTSPLSLLCPVFSLAACPHLRCGRAAETKEKQYLWEHASHPHMVLAASPPFSEFVSQPCSPETLFCYWFLLLTS